MAEQAPDRVHRVAVAVVVSGGRVVLCHRHPDRRWFPDLWDLPGGHIDCGESAAEALVRELREELGIQVDPRSLEFVARRQATPDLELHVWIVRRWTGDVTNRAPDEHDAVGWFTAREIRGLEVADPDVVDWATIALGAGAAACEPYSK